jgi:hypothetical protein
MRSDVAGIAIARMSSRIWYVFSTVIVEHIIESGPDEMTEEQAKRIIEIYGQLPEEVKAKK